MRFVILEYFDPGVFKCFDSIPTFVAAVHNHYNQGCLSDLLQSAIHGPDYCAAGFIGRNDDRNIGTAGRSVFHWLALISKGGRCAWLRRLPRLPRWKQGHAQWPDSLAAPKTSRRFKMSIYGKARQAI